MEFNLQSEQAFLIRNETILLLSEALLPLSTMVSTNPVFPGSLPFIVSGKSFEEKDFMDLIYTAIDSSIVSYSTRGVTSLRPTFFRSKSIRLSDSNIVISTVMLLMSLLANLAMH